MVIWNGWWPSCKLTSTSVVYSKWRHIERRTLLSCRRHRLLAVLPSSCYRPHGNACVPRRRGEEAEGFPRERVRSLGRSLSCDALPQFTLAAKWLLFHSFSASLHIVILLFVFVLCIFVILFIECSNKVIICRRFIMEVEEATVLLLLALVC